MVKALLPAAKKKCVYAPRYTAKREGDVLAYIKINNQKNKRGVYFLTIELCA